MPPINRIVFFYAAIPPRVFVRAEIFSNFVLADVRMDRGEHIESVFALSFKENVAIFNSKGQRTALILAWIMAGRTLCVQISHIHQVWGIASFILLWVRHNLL